MSAILTKVQLRRALRTSIDVAAIAPIIVKTLEGAEDPEQRSVASVFARVSAHLAPIRSRLAQVDADDEVCDQTLARLVRARPSLPKDLVGLEQLWEFAGVASRMIYKPTKDARRDAPQSVAPREDRLANKRLLVLEAFAGRTVLRGKPWRHLIDASSVCNLRCRTCYQSNSQNFIYYDVSSIENVAIREAMPFAEYVNIAGTGEPLLSASTVEIAKLYSNCGAQVEITTNGTLPARMAAIAPYVHGINLSMDGATKATFEAIRFGASFERTLSGVRSLAPEDRQKININFVVCSLNAHEAADAIALANDLEVGSVTFQEFHPYLSWHREMELGSGDRTMFFSSLESATPKVPVIVHVARSEAAGEPGANRVGLSHLDQVTQPQQTRLTWQELRAGLEAVVDDALGFAAALVEDVNKISVISQDGDATAEQLVDQIQLNIRNGSARSPFCLAPFNMLYVQGDGEVRPCCVLRTQVGSLPNSNFDDAWNDPAFVAFRSSIQGRTAPHPGCSGCRDGGRFADIVDVLKILSDEGLDIRKIARPAEAELPELVRRHPLVIEWGADVIG